MADENEKEQPIEIKDKRHFAKDGSVRPDSEREKKDKIPEPEEDKKEEAEVIFEKLTYKELSVSIDFYNEFVSAIFLPHTNLELFPSVKEIV